MVPFGRAGAHRRRPGRPRHRSHRARWLWLTDITEHPTREGELYCCVVLDAYSRRVVGWSIDSTRAATLVTSALGVAITDRDPQPGTVIHSDHWVQYAFLGIHRASQGLRPVALDGERRRLLR
ncbi:DDE-type integrase/transposase/recombinase [Nonomuraea sp. MTCD27]|uniref:DDE-type integrase/transposase/recombinase n=1 Tax=Nonomuraea sp. MTCD27 TaxID=1676747 RepID=UPI0035BFF3DC